MCADEVRIVVAGDKDAGTRLDISSALGAIVTISLVFTYKSLMETSNFAS